ncbi:MAG: hypothetical protein RR490_01005, partial [Niameybacter sp.]
IPMLREKKKYKLEKLFTAKILWGILMTKIKYVFLTHQFYDDYKNCIQIEQKQDRPYVQLVVKIDELYFALPFRSNISHEFAFWTDKDNKCGIDYSKAVVIMDSKYIDTEAKPQIRQNEHASIIGSEHLIEKGFKAYLKTYKKALRKQEVNRNRVICQFSALQYFHDEMRIEL